MFYTQAVSERLRATGDIGMLQLQHGQIAVHGSKHKVLHDNFRARKMPKNLAEDGRTGAVWDTVRQIKQGIKVA